MSFVVSMGRGNKKAARHKLEVQDIPCEPSYLRSLDEQTGSVETKVITNTADFLFRKKSISRKARDNMDVDLDEYLEPIRIVILTRIT